MIVCLGWGSLVWNPESLSIKDEWQHDGPLLPVEFLRQSSDGRLTLVIDPSSPPVQVLWAEMNVSELSEAVKQLKNREGTSSSNIGRWPEASTYSYGKEIGTWAVSKGISGVVWTALGSKFSGTDDLRPSQDEAVAYLSGLNGEQEQLAKEYVQKAPLQIDTHYRRVFATKFGW